MLENNIILTVKSSYISYVLVAYSYYHHPSIIVVTCSNIGDSGDSGNIGNIVRGSNCCTNNTEVTNSL